MDQTSLKLPRILILDDENELRIMLTRYLRNHQFDVVAVADSIRLNCVLQRAHFDVLILDIMMEPEDGLTVCRRLRADGQTIPILMLTAKGAPSDRIAGLETGADDYLVKPFLPEELVARIRAVLRRQAIDAGMMPDMPSRVTFGPYVLNIRQRELCCDGQRILIHSAEMQLLIALASFLNRPMSREILMSKARGRDYNAHDRSIDVQVLRLRRIIETDPASPQWIKTVWGCGYMLAGVAE